MFTLFGVEAAYQFATMAGTFYVFHVFNKRLNKWTERTVHETNKLLVEVKGKAQGFQIESASKRDLADMAVYAMRTAMGRRNPANRMSY